MDTYAKQLDTLAKSKVSALADNLAGKLHHADEAISEAARNFRLNLELEPQLVNGVMSSSSAGRLSKLGDKLQAFAKSLDGSVDEVVRSGRLQDVFIPEPVKLPSGEVAYRSADVFNGESVLVRSPEFLDDYGHIKWPEADGFVVDEAGKPITEQANLKAGQMIDRYGSSGGRFTSPLENGEKLAYDTRGLPYPESFYPYHQYEVVMDINVENIVEAYNGSSKVIQGKVFVEMKKWNLSFEDLANIRRGEIAEVFGAGGGI